MKWFPVDSDTPNDPKIKSLLRRQGKGGLGSLFMLWCHIGDHGSADPGLGVKADGSPLALGEMADELLFDDQPQLVAFLDDLADHALIHPDLWRDRGIIFLPAMWNRMIGYARGKGRKVSNCSSANEIVASVMANTPAVPTRPAKAQPSPRRPRAARTSPELPLQDKTLQHKTDQGLGTPMPTKHPIRDVLTFHDGLFTKATGKPYPDYTAGDAKNVGLMLQKTPQADLEAEIQQMFDSQDPFILQCGYTIGAFMKVRAKLMVARVRPSGPAAPASSGRTATTPGKYAGV